MIKIRNLTKKFSDKLIFDNISFEINDSSKIYAITGESGIGKTTLFNTLFGLDQDFKGIYDLFGKNISEYSTLERASLRENEVKLVFQDFKLLEKLSVYDNLFFSGNYSKGEIDDSLTKLLVNLKFQNIHNFGKNSEFYGCFSIINSWNKQQKFAVLANISFY